MPTDSSPLSAGLRAMARFYVGDATLHEALQRVSELSLEALPGADFAGITMLLEGRPRTGVFTDEAAPEIDSTQYETGIGPCMDAFRHKQVFRIDDVHTDHQWVAFSETAAAYGVCSVMSLPLIAGHEGLGALNFYSRTKAFSDEDVEVGIAFATQAAILLANAQAYWDAQQLSENVNAAMQSRAIIEQAKGILMGAQQCTADEAFQILVRISQRENRKLREIAEEFVTRTRQLDSSAFSQL